MLRASLLALLPFLTVQAAVAQTQSGRDSGREYPAWFLAAPESRVLTSVGIAPRYATDSTSVAEATERALEALALAIKSRVSVQMATEAYANVRDFRGEDYQETALADPGHAAVVLDTAFLDKVVMVLVGTSRIAVDRHRVQMPDSVPSWVSTPPASTSTGSIALGTAPMYFYEQNSWIEAEARGRKAAAYDAATKIRTLSRSNNGDFTSVTVQSADAMLEGAQVVRRWRDARAAYVLLRVNSVTGTTARERR